MAGGKNKLTQEEEVLLQDFSRTVSKKSQALFYGNALMVALLPLWLFWKVHLMDPMSYAALFTGGTLVSAYLVSLVVILTRNFFFGQILGSGVGINDNFSLKLIKNMQF